MDALRRADWRGEFRANGYMVPGSFVVVDHVLVCAPDVAAKLRATEREKATSPAEAEKVA